MRTHRPRRPWLLAALCLTSSLLLLGLLEAGARAVLRISSGSWPQTRASRAQEQVLATRALFRRHPYLGIVGRGEATQAIDRRTMTGNEGLGSRFAFNSLGYRSPERPREKPAGVRRVLCSGGSTTADTLAPSYEATWPAILEAELNDHGVPAEVWNAGVPGWTSLESLVSLLIRDVDLDPDVVVLNQGLNDLQPASHRPFDGQYEHGHAELIVRAMGLDAPPPSWRERSVLIERLGDLVAPAPPGLRPLVAGEDPGRRRSEIPQAALAAFERNLRSFIGVAQAHGARVVLVTQVMRIRAAHSDADKAHLAWWIPGLVPEAAPRELERLNAVVRRLADGDRVRVVDVAADVEWSDDDFGDPFHFVGSAGERFASAVAAAVLEALEQRSPQVQTRP